MASTREYEGRNVEKAVQNASEALDIDAAKIKYDVISYGSSGIFGLVGTKKARIRVRVAQKRNNTAVKTNTSLDERAVPPPDPVPSASSPRNSEETEHAEVDPTGDGEEANAPDSAQSFSDSQEARNETDPNEAAVSWDQSEKLAREVMAHIVGSITPDAEIISHQSQGQIEYDVVGGNTAMVIGKRGQTLEAIQYLVEKIVNKQRSDRIRIHIDAGGYMRKRQENLEQIAFRVANKAKRMGRPGSMGQLNPHDRRIVHLALRRDEGVWTKSIGDGHLRKLVIYPKRQPNEAQDRPSS